jgi:FkbM family methyltransferase
LKRFLKRIPGLHAAYRRVFRFGEPGRWLFQADTLEWMRDRGLRKQLPAPFRVFALYCRVHSFWGIPVLLGPLAFRIAHRAHVRRGGGAILLDVAGQGIFIDPGDPEMLEVPHTLLALTKPSSVLNRFLSEGDSFVDTGANHGAYCVAASAVVGDAGVIVAFEPQPTLSELVERSLSENGVKNFTVYPFACSDVDGETDFFVPRAASGLAGLHAAFSGRSRHDKLRVGMVRLDEILEPLALPGSVLIKLDVEGHEAAVLRGGTGFIRARRPRLLMEVNPKAMAVAGTTREELHELLASLGCRAYRPAHDLDQVHELDTLDAGRFHNVVFEFG